jgi:O-antigen/teichoic acid export membrane protein
MMDRSAPTNATSAQPGSQWTAHPGRHMLEGSIRNLLAEALFPLTALVTAGVLTRQLGAGGYGLLVLAVSFVLLIQWSLNAIFSRATIKHVSEAADWRSVGTAAVNLQLMVGLGAMAAIWLLAVPLGRLMGEPDLPWSLGLMAVDIPLACLTQSHRQILTGLGRFGQCGLLSAGRWTVRLVLTIGFVFAGWGITGAILGMIGGTAGELVLARRAIRPALFRRVSWTEWPLWDYAMPLFFSSVCGALFVRLDLYSLKALGGSAVQAGLYGAAQNLSLLPSLLGAVVAPIVLSAVSRVLSTGDVTNAAELSRNAVRAAILSWPLAALIGGTADPLVVLIFGDVFIQAGTLLTILAAGAFVMLVTTMSLTLLVVFGKPRLLVLITAPLVLLALTGHMLAVPRWGPMGAAGVTCMLSVAAAISATWLAVRECGVRFPGASLGRSVLAAGVMIGFALLWPAVGVWVFLKLAFGSLLLMGTYWALGEFNQEELAMGRNLLYAQAFSSRCSTETVT